MIHQLGILAHLGAITQSQNRESGCIHPFGCIAPKESFPTSRPSGYRAMAI